MTSSESNGLKARDCLAEVDKSGSFQRKESVFRNFIEEGGKFPPEAGRYHLYAANACPWANRCHMVLKMKGLEDAIGVSIVHPTWQRTKPEVDEHAGWVFYDPGQPPVANQMGKGSISCEGCVPDTVNGAKTIRELYELAGDTFAKYTVPILWDKQLKAIVNNESAEIILMLNKAFNKVAKNPELDLLPEHLADAMKEADSWIYPHINNGVYRCGFATTQEAYNAAYKDLFDHLQRAEELLSQSRYLTGDTFTAMDLKLFMTLVRFDPVYVVYFKCYGKRIEEYPNLWNFTKEIYQIPIVQALTKMDHIVNHYYTSHPTLNTHAIIPARPIADMLSPHDREAKFPSSSKKQKLG